MCCDVAVNPYTTPVVKRRASWPFMKLIYCRAVRSDSRQDSRSSCCLTMLDKAQRPQPLGGTRDQGFPWPPTPDSLQIGFVLVNERARASLIIQSFTHFAVQRVRTPWSCSISWSPLRFSLCHFYFQRPLARCWSSGAQLLEVLS